MTILNDILKHKRAEVEHRKRLLPLAKIRDAAERQAVPAVSCELCGDGSMPMRAP